MKLRYFILSALLLAGMTSCYSALELYPLDSPSADTFYKTEEELQGGVNGCYGLIIDVTGDYGDARYGLDGLSDIVYLRGAPDFNDMIQGSHDNKSSVSTNTWSRLYQGVGRCNLLLSKIEENRKAVSDAKYAQFVGEVLFLRGYYYLRLIQHFGDVVYTDKPIVSVAEAAAVKRTPNAEVYKNILADFDKAASLLENSSIKTLGRATWGAAMAYKARAALYQGDWATATAAAKTVIDSKRYDLEPSYAKLFTEEGVRNVSNKEQIFVIDHDRVAGRTSAYLMFAGSRAMGGWSTIVPTQNLIDSYECIDGQDIATSPLYDRTKPYENRDPRLRMSIVLPGDMWYGANATPMRRFETHMDSTMTTTITGERVKNGDSYSTTAFTTFTGYLFSKYISYQYIANTSADETPFMLCRFAEVLLTFAEAKIEMNQIDAECLDAINRVRGRADVNMPAIAPGLSQQQMRRVVRLERKVELASENLRLQDLRRWKRAEVLLNQAVLGRPVLGGFADYPKVKFDEFGDPIYDAPSYKPHPSSDYRVVIQAKFDPARDYLWGIPEKDLSLNPGLGQNPGY